MSLLNPGGLRAASMFRIFGFENINRALQKRSTDHRHKAQGSIAQGNRNIYNIRTGARAPHLHEREIARRLRQRGVSQA